MAKRKKRPEWLSVSVAALRKASRWWKPAAEAERLATPSRGYRVCAKSKDMVHHSKAAKDHVIPTVPVTGWDSLDGFAERLFVGIDGWQILCDECHQAKTNSESEQRRANIKEKENVDRKKAKRFTRRFKSERRKKSNKRSRRKHTK